jgi:hypothetical protein
MASLTLLLFYAPFHAISAFFAGLFNQLKAVGGLNLPLAPQPARTSQSAHQATLKR